MKTMTYKCDRCGIEWTGGENVLYRVLFRVEGGSGERGQEVTLRGAGA